MNIELEHLLLADRCNVVRLARSLGVPDPGRLSLRKLAKAVMAAMALLEATPAGTVPKRMDDVHEEELSDAPVPPVGRPVGLRFHRDRGGPWRSCPYCVAKIGSACMASRAA